MRRLAPQGTMAKATPLAMCLILSLVAQGKAQSVGGSGSVSLSSEAGANAQGNANASQSAAPSAPAAAAKKELTAEQMRWRELRAGATYYGPVGGFFLTDAGSGAPGSFRLQMASDFFAKKNYLQADDKNRYVGSALTLGITPIEYLEISGAVTTRTNRNDSYTQESLSALGDLRFNVKGYYEPTAGLTFGADVGVGFLGDQNGSGVVLDSTMVGLRGNLSLDLRELADDVPMQVRLNLGYTFDNSANTVSGLEDARYKNLVENGETSADNQEDDYNHYINRHERLAFGVNRVDRFTIGVGAEFPVELTDQIALHPIAEWQLDVPVNRQDFDCPYVLDANGNKLAGTDSCLNKEGVDTWPQSLTIGARLWPYQGLNILAGVNIGLGGTTNYVQELAPTPPYRIVLAAGYTIDTRPKPPVVREVEKRVEVAVAPKTGRVRGTIIEQDVGTVVADAKISFPGKDVTPLWGAADGTFVSYPFDPGEVVIEAEAEGYQPGTCGATIAPEGGDVTISCALVALPRYGAITGQVLGIDSVPLPGVRISLTGPSARNVLTDFAGKINERELPPGEYSARIEQEGYLISITPITVKAREDAQVSIQLVPVPKVAQVAVRKDKIQIKSTIYFTVDTAEIEKRSEPLLTEIADTMLRHPELLKIEVQGHTDDTGTTEHNVELSQNRADAVKAWLVRAGVEADRLVAKGYGVEKPIVPNLTPVNRAKNRRVEFIILDRAGE